MHSRLSQWFFRIAAGIQTKVTEKKSAAYQLKSFLFGIADMLDDIVELLLRIKAKYSWRCDQIRSRFIKDEFDRSLDINTETYLHLSQEDQAKYDQDLLRRRMIAHERDFTDGKC